MSQENRQREKNSTWNIKPYLAVGLTALLVILISIAFFFFVYRYEGATNWAKAFSEVFQPIAFGIVIAYLLNPMMNRIQAFLKKKTKFPAKVIKILAITGAMIIGLMIVTGFSWIVIPQVYESIEELIIGMPQMIEDTATGIQKIWDDNEFLSTYFGGVFEKTATYVENFIEVEFLPKISVIISQITSGIVFMAKGILNALIGVIVSVYVLMEKDHFIAIGKKLVFGICSRKAGNVIVTTAKKAHSIFSGFIIGKIIDSAIIGVLTFIVLSIVKMPSALLVSVIVGVTNVIPFFGPFIGAIPSFFLILIQDPIKSLWFVLIILIIQQIDGNIIGPKILGDTTGLSSFWVVTAIVVSGGLFGFTGMVLGVPLFALIYYCMDELTKFLLKKKGLPEDTETYFNVKERDIHSGELIFYPEEEHKASEKTEEEN